MPFKVLIADDEMLARYSLHTFISKNFDNLLVVGEAENGRQAIEMALDLNPEIIIMDIKMPGINGIEASKEILKEKPRTLIIILSAHDNFSYAQNALNEGVKSYILKPFQKKDMINKLSEIITVLENRKSTQPDYKKMLPFLEEELIALLIGDNDDLTIREQINNILHMDIESGLFALINFPGLSDDERKQAAQILKKKIPCISSGRTGADMAFFISGESINSDVEKLNSILLEYSCKIQRLFRTDLLCGLGKLMNDQIDFEQSFHQAMISLKTAGSDNNNIITYEENLLYHNSSSEKYPRELESRLLEKLQARDFNGTDDLITSITSEISGIKDVRIKKEFAAQFLVMLSRTANFLGSDDKKNISDFLIQDLIKLDSDSEIKHLIKSTGFQVVKNLQSVDGDSNWWLERAFIYMKKHIYTEISLDIIADEIKISPQHLSRIFKSKYGKTIGEYITDQRIAYAKYLLSNSEYSIKDISGKTGYTDQNYFSRVFKKHTGFTPSIYKESTQ